MRITGEICPDGWGFRWDTECSAFQAALAATDGADVTVWINSPGGETSTASAIYTALCEHPGRVTVKIDGMAASAASVIAMAGDDVYMSPTSVMMIHNPSTIALGDAAEMEKTRNMLGEITESIVNAYERKCKRPRDEIKKMMADETWMSAARAMEFGFADGVLYAGDGAEPGAVACLVTASAIYGQGGHMITDREIAERAEIARAAREWLQNKQGD